MKVIKKFYNLDYTNIQKTPNNSLNVDKSRETWTDGNPSLTETFIDWELIGITLFLHN